MEWHQIVGSFDTGPVADEEESPELEVLSTMVKSICLPRLKARLPLYDPFVPQQTRDLLAIVSDLRDYVASDSPAFKGLTAIVQNLLEMWIAEFADRYGSESPHVPVAADAKPDGPLEARTRLVGAFRPVSLKKSAGARSKANSEFFFNRCLRALWLGDGTWDPRRQRDSRRPF
jgi:hypothetical protein